MTKKINKQKKNRKRSSIPLSRTAKKVDSPDLYIEQMIQLALQHHRAGNLPQAEQLYQQVLQADPHNAAANHFLGIIATQQEGKIDMAVRLLRKAIRAEPHNADAYYNLGVALKQAGKLKEAIACYRQALSLKPQYISSLNNLGLALQESGKLAKAASCFRKVLSLEPNHYKAHNNLGNVFKETGRLDEAIACYKKALALKPDYAEARFNIGVVLQDSGRMDEAIACYKKALALKPDYAEAHNNLGNVFRKTGKLDEAMASYKKASAIKPDYAEAQFNISVVLQESGRMNEAIASYRRTLAIKPDYGEAYRTLAAIEQHFEYDNEIQTMENLYTKKNLRNEDRMHLGFALGKIFEELKQYDKAFRFIADANRLKRRSYEYSIQTDHDLFERIKKTFSPIFFSSHQGSGCLDETPIFIVGMPRSGTTLVEQILASHPLVFGAGELTDLNDLTDNSCAGATKTRFPECVLSLDTAALKKMGADYIERVRHHTKEVRYITDKLPHNFLRVGLIKAILPKAKVIHCMRDPMDTCLSIFKNYFAAKGSHEYAYDLRELGQHYNLYLDLMEHWERVLPGYMYTLRYEEMINDQQKQTRGLLEYCDLPWDEACLNFHKTKRKVATASFVQVRQPIYKDSMQLWRRYETQLEPLRKAIYPEKA